MKVRLSFFALPGVGGARAHTGEVAPDQHGQSPCLVRINIGVSLAIFAAHTAAEWSV
jgi:hypothetical protein